MDQDMARALDETFSPFCDIFHTRQEVSGRDYARLLGYNILTTLLSHTRTTLEKVMWRGIFKLHKDALGTVLLDTRTQLDSLMNAIQLNAVLFCFFFFFTAC